MTVIAAAEDSTGVWIGSDSKGIAGDVTYELGSKIIKKNQYYIGFSDSYRAADLIRECDDFPQTIGSMNTLRQFRDTLKDIMIKDGCSTMGSEGNTIMHPIDVLIISNNGIYSVDGDYQIHKIDSYAATGSGFQLAMGALRSVMSATGSAKEAVMLAVEAAIYHSSSCGGDVYVECIHRRNRG